MRADSASADTLIRNLWDRTGAADMQGAERQAGGAGDEPTVTSAACVTTALPPCAIVNDSAGDRLVVGTYELHKDSGRRSGSLDVYTPALDCTHTVRTESAVLDVRLVESTLVSAHSTGEVRLWDADLHQIDEIRLSDDALVTQIAVHDNLLGAVLTSGEAVVYDLTAHEETYRERVHDLEAWTVIFHDGLVYTGGDDRALASIDPRIPYVLWKVKPHDAGLTSILPRSGLLWTGGYDDCLNQFDPRTRRATDSVNLGGGVWRLIPNPSDTAVLACCMYGGLRVLDAHAFGAVRGSLTNHESMVYGGAWASDRTGYTCSFYDKMLQKWSYRL